MARDERGLVVAWLVRIVVGLALLAVVLFDAGAIVVNYFSVDGTADEVALAVAADVIGSGRDPVPNLRCRRRSPDPTCREVFDVARDEDVSVVSASFDQEGVFHVEVRRTAKTLLVGRIGAIEDWATATASAQADTN
jgi:hypothetical protein